MEAPVSHPAQPDSAALARRRDSNLMRSVNTDLRRHSEAQAAEESIAFFCECRSPNCYAPIWMSAPAFDATTEDQSAWLLHEGHEPSALWQRREPLPTRTSLRTKLAAADGDAAAQGRGPSKSDPGQPRHLRLVALGALLPIREARRSRVKAHA